MSSPLHANNANQALERIISFFPTEAKDGLLLNLSLNLAAVISQRLIAGKLKKRVAVFEVLKNTPYGIGMNTFDQALYELFKNDQIDENSALVNADSRNDLSLKIRFNAERDLSGFGQ